jgi:hypothetical protein
LGDNRSGDLQIWNNANINDYLWKGGNVIIMSQMGHAFFEEELNKKYELEWLEESTASLEYCTSVFDGLEDIKITGPQPFNSVFDTSLTNSESVLLFKETIPNFVTRGLGFWNKPILGGAYKNNGGQFVYISGKPYRYNYEDLKHNFEYILEFLFNETDISDIDENDSELITSYKLEQNYPNPFNPITTIQYQIPKDGLVRLQIFDILGQKVTTLVNEINKRGRYKIEFNATNLSSGIYFYRLTADNFSDVKKLILIK